MSMPMVLAFQLSTLVLGLVLAVRLLRMAARTRKAPELAMGLYCAFVPMGAALFGVAYAANTDATMESTTLWLLSALSTLCIGVGAVALAVGIWRIFRPGERWAAALAMGLGVWIGAGWLACVLPGETVTLADTTWTNLLFLAGRLSVYGFGAFEAFRYSAMLQRRVALGLADPVSAHQIRLWGVAWVCVAVLGTTSVVIMHFGGEAAFEWAWPPLLLSGLNAAAWVCTWLAFFPPVSYQRWVERARAEA